MKDFSRFSVFQGGVFAMTVICFQASYQSFHFYKMFVHPWKGIIANIPTTLQDGKHVGESGRKLREDLAKAIIEFNKEWDGLNSAIMFEKSFEYYNNAIAFEKSFELDHWRKKDSIIIRMGCYVYGCRFSSHSPIRTF
ncbi:hypothetical protein E1A91_A12G014500v1 [Gossypium mustelinum]|uniref:XS domain-containing protein n=1 Tax=Gossypium mustelinum TaxID=34275 RepID=A0A5D2WQG7_GOSMU|nr:hypothetical protein E1A91_A12G014500v1 [Gossypium mustelinum]